MRQEMYEELLRYIAFYSFFWAIVFFICMMRYSFGDRKHVHTLIRKLAKDPDWYLKDDGVMSILISGMSAGGFLVIYSFIYPLVVHRSFKRGYKIDIMMWLHWLWCMSFAFLGFMSDIFLYSIGFYSRGLTWCSCESLLDKASPMVDEILRDIAIFCFIWTIPFFFYHFRYSLGDRCHINGLIKKLSKNPSWYETKGLFVVSGIGAGAVFNTYCLIYPFIRHREKGISIKFDIMMWLHWFWCMCCLLILINTILS